MSGYFLLSTYDERGNNYITLQDNPEGGGPLVYVRYLDYLCPTCRSLDRVALFARKWGLEGGPKIRVSKCRELAEARDGFLLIKSRVVELLKKHKVGGYETRTVPYTDWHALRVTHRVAYRDFTPEWDKRRGPCATCGRGAYYGIAQRLRDIAVPEQGNTLFGPEVERTNAYDVFLTEDVARMLKSSGVKGGLLIRLLDDEEYRLFCEGTPAARRKLKDYRIYLT
jgi:hypothetical protein